MRLMFEFWTVWILILIPELSFFLFFLDYCICILLVRAMETSPVLNSSVLISTNWVHLEHSPQSSEPFSHYLKWIFTRDLQFSKTSPLYNYCNKSDTSHFSVNLQWIQLYLSHHQFSNFSIQLSSWSHDEGTSHTKFIISNGHRSSSFIIAKSQTDNSILQTSNWSSPINFSVSRERVIWFTVITLWIDLLFSKKMLWLKCSLVYPSTDHSMNRNMGKSKWDNELWNEKN